MKVSVAWIGVILITVVLLVFSVKGYKIYESFKNENEQFVSYVEKEGFETVIEIPDPLDRDIVLKSCPVDTTFYIDAKGRGACCDSRIVNNKCSGKVICSLSEGSSGLPTCGEYYSAILDEKGTKLCNSSFPNYFESSSKRGCTSGRRTKDGSAPLFPNNDPYCMLYTSETEELTQLDSCTNAKLFENTQCFTHTVEGATKTLESMDTLPALVSCSYTDSQDLYFGSLPRKCYSDESLERYLNARITNGSISKRILETPKDDRWCSVAQAKYIDHTVESSTPATAPGASMMAPSASMTTPTSILGSLGL